MTLDLDKTIEGTYEYSSTKISLKRDDGDITVCKKSQRDGKKEIIFISKSVII